MSPAYWILLALSLAAVAVAGVLVYKGLQARGGSDMKPIDLDGDGVILRDEIKALGEKAMGRLDKGERKRIRRKALALGQELLIAAADQQITPAEWAKIGEKAKALGVEIGRDLADG
jgi:hypothetical protein